MTDQPKWTPAPWALEIRAGSGTAADCTIAMIEQADERAPYRGMIARLQSAEHIEGIAKDEMVANAHLIFAAPDMADALANLIARYDEVVTTPDCSCGQDDHDVMKARSALSKARGGA